MYTTYFNVNDTRLQDRGVLASVHAEGCKDLARYDSTARHYYTTADTVLEALTMAVDEEMVSMGYTATDVHVSACCKASKADLDRDRAEHAAIMADVELE